MQYAQYTSCTTAKAKGEAISMQLAQYVHIAQSLLRALALAKALVHSA